eukprot:TRINITY_DN3645_c0_g4_i1.p1 TRINITY_DN3645_c0_g4~~TRINITY_DN3645_c0_g4_i1.p1  ORF type:complete len:290 (-),score=21.06 TRINITY_DN3645_c0_g4_i1:131-1000(-)
MGTPKPQNPFDGENMRSNSISTRCSFNYSNMEDRPPEPSLSKALCGTQTAFKSRRKLTIRLLPKVPKGFPDIFVPKQSPRVYSSIGSVSRQSSTPSLKRCSAPQVACPKSTAQSKLHKHPSLCPNLFNFLPEIKPESSRSAINMNLRLKSFEQSATRLNTNQIANLQLLLARSPTTSHTKKEEHPETRRLLLEKLKRVPLSGRNLNAEDLRQRIQVSVESSPFNKRAIDKYSTVRKDRNTPFDGKLKRLHVQRLSVFKMKVAPVTELRENKLPSPDFTFGKEQFSQCGR